VALLQANMSRSFLKLLSLSLHCGNWKKRFQKTRVAICTLFS